MGNFAPLGDPLAAIRARTAAILGDLLQPGEHVALVDYPNHENAGDHLIFVGQARYLRDLGVRVGYIGDITRYDKGDLDHFVPQGPILIQGGGNFGDRWTQIQEFRERVIAENHDRRIIQLPQSIDFSTPEGIARAQATYAAHPDLTILIRDTAGADRTRELFPRNTVIFCPDLALGAEVHPPAMKLQEHPADVVYLKRGDSESTGSTVTFSESTSYVVTDWGLSGVDKLKWWAYHLPGAISRRVPTLRRPLYPLQHRLYYAMCDLNVRSARRHLAKGRVLVTDRLHASVLGVLMGKPVIAIDNANGKVSSIYGDYLHTMTNMQMATDPANARERADQLLKL